VAGPGGPLFAAAVTVDREVLSPIAGMDMDERDGKISEDPRVGEEN